MKGENWQEMATSLSLKWLWAGWEEEMASWNLNFVLLIWLSLWLKAPKYKGVGTTVSTMVWRGCMVIIHTFNPILLFSLFCFLGFLFCKCQGLVRWPPICEGMQSPRYPWVALTCLKGWPDALEEKLDLLWFVGPAFWCQHTVTSQAVCLIK